jgi:nicotinamide riboside kinase
VYLCSSYEFVVIKSLYAAVLRGIELDHIDWDDSFQYFQQYENSILTSYVDKKGTNVKHNKIAMNKTDIVGTVCFCSHYQRNKCIQNHNPHILSINSKIVSTYLCFILGKGHS